MPFKRLLNYSEEKTHQKLREMCEQNGASVFPKVRVADILPIEKSGISDQEFRFALQSHFDFTFCDENHTPLFAIEFDGALHEEKVQRARDIQKGRLCKHFGFPILRINSSYIEREFRGMDLLTYFIEVWFHAQAFYEAQEQGLIPLDEDFDPASIVTPRQGKLFPYWLSLEVKIKIEELHSKGMIIDYRVSHIIAKDTQGDYRAMGYIFITSNTGICAFTAMHSQDFPIIESDVLGELIVFETYEALLDVLSGRHKPWSGTEIDAKIKEFHKRYGALQFCSISCSSHGRTG
ncbi:MAG: DUF2726 domain-containing protein [Acidobacteria bacterium]|nr:DUF2726 domain-containing protein [Acidobacteriota bacterium]